MLWASPILSGRMKFLSSLTGKPILLFLTAAAFGLRLAYLLHSHPFFDEFTTVLAAQAILQRGLPLLPSGLFYEHGVLFTYLDAPLVGLAGDSGLYIAARLPSLILGTAAVPLLYWLGRRWLTPRAGLVAAALLALSPEGMVWGGRARMYAMLQLLVILLVFFAYQGCLGEGRPRWRWVALLTLLAALLTQFGALILVPPLVIAAVAIGWLTRPGGRRPWFMHRAALVEGAALALVVGLGILVKRLGQPLGAAPLGSDGAGNLLGELVGTITYQAGLVLDGGAAIKFLGQQFGVPHHVWLACVALAGGLVGLGLWLAARRPAREATAGAQPARDSRPPASPSYSLLPTPYSSLYLWLVFGLAVVEMVTLLEPWRRNPRYLVMLLPLFYLGVAAGLEQIANIKRQTSSVKPLMPNLLLSLFVVVQAALLVPDLRIAYLTPEPAYEEAFRYVRDGWQPGDALLTMNTSAAGLYLGQAGAAPPGAYRFAAQEDAEQFLLNVGTRPVDRWLGVPWVGTAADFNRVLNEHPRAWFVVDTIRLPVYYRGDWLALLKTQMELVWSGDEAMVYRTRPDRSPLPSAPAVTVNADLGGLVRLVGYRVDKLSPPVACECDTSAWQRARQVTLFWTPLAPIPDDYTVFIHVRDAKGANVAQRDAQPLGGDYPTHQWRAGETVIDPYRIDLPANLPPGEYRIVVGMYRLETLERLPVAGDTSGENAVSLGAVTLP
jgi:4-amino-4-deoxy-L-arabinose transferase-like glycosyltransferase